MNQTPPQFSRITATAESLGDAAPDRHRFADKSVLITGEREILSTINGRQCFLDTTRLLIRMVRGLVIHVPGIRELEDEVTSLVEAISFGSKPLITTLSDIKYEDFDAILSVGSSGRSGLPWTVINSNGWVARVSSKGQSLPVECSQPNPVGALGAACLGVAEVFKRLICLKPERGQLHDKLVFSFYSYASDDNPGPEITREIALDLLLVGVGAIGNGTIHLLRGLPIAGEIKVVDNQNFGEENWGTCILLEPKDFGKEKAIMGAIWLREKVTTKGYPEKIETFKDRCGKEINHPRLIVNGLDNIPARRSVQDFWADQIIDGAISATGCEVTLHPWGPDLSCLKCDFEEPKINSELVQTQATGLRRERLADQTALIDDNDIESAPEEKRAWLQERKGRDICSVVSEGVLAEMAGESQKAGFRPSVPFVAALSSCMIVSELLRYVGKSPVVLETGFQFDVLVGPQFGQKKAHARKPDCICVSRRSNIEILRRRWFNFENTTETNIIRDNI